jgi:aspartyl-tRNA(Asn)/glutamyl-tRNA(Gln) amidotransferase subunit C
MSCGELRSDLYHAYGRDDSANPTRSTCMLDSQNEYGPVVSKIAAAGTVSQRSDDAMKLSLEEVDHVAMLARLGLEPDERERMRDQLSSILDHISLLESVDTSAILPTAQVITLQNRMREDEPEPGLSVEDVLRNAPDSEDDMFKVNAVLE